MKPKKSNNTRKFLILLLVVIILIIMVLIYCLFMDSGNDESQQNIDETVQENFEENTEIESDDSNYYERTEAWYKDPYNTGSATMPDLVGMNCRDLRDYLDNNYLYFIDNIKYKFNDSAKGNNLLPTKIISTIPAAGTELDPYTDTSITVLAEYVYGVENIEMELPSSDFVKQNFGKTIKIQFGNDENQYVEHIIGESFIKRYDYLATTKQTLSWDTVKEKKCTYVIKDDITTVEDHKYNTLPNYYVTGKVWVDGEFLKEIKFTYGQGTLIEATGN